MYLGAMKGSYSEVTSHTGAPRDSRRMCRTGCCRAGSKNKYLDVQSFARPWPDKCPQFCWRAKVLWWCSTLQQGWQSELVYLTLRACLPGAPGPAACTPGCAGSKVVSSITYSILAFHQPLSVGTLPYKYQYTRRSISRTARYRNNVTVMHLMVKLQPCHSPGKATSQLTTYST